MGRAARSAIIGGLIASGATLAFGNAADAGTMIFDANSPYLSASDSPFSDIDFSSYFYLEDFENGISSTGFFAYEGTLRDPGTMTDSVDFDDGVIDGFGQDGYSWAVEGLEGQGAELTIEFQAFSLGQLPTHAGLVWTDGNEDAMVTITAFGAGGNTLGTLTTMLGDGLHDGSTAADRFLGAQYDEGIFQLRISVSMGNLEIDHLQYGFGAVVIPLPPALAMGVAGLGLIALKRRKLNSGVR